MSVLDALKGVLKIALIHDGLARGLREASKALDRRQAHMCVLNEGCEEEAYKKLVVALCSEHKIPLIKVPDGKLLGEWVGLCMFSPLLLLLRLLSYYFFFTVFFFVPCGREHFMLTFNQLQANSTVKATPARSSTAPASSSVTGVRSLRSAPSCSTTSRLSSKR
jgi:ribosomal protein L7Ae-like RNA K-turn-binding protein